jgi:hypothetical protein
MSIKSSAGGIHFVFLPRLTLYINSSAAIDIEESSTLTGNNSKIIA